jgi:two-component system, cell cycle response regulator
MDSEQVHSAMNGKILIVDDVATNRIVFKVKLGAASYNPLMASGGIECLRLASEHRPNLILLDLMLPDLPGVDVLRKLRSNPITQDIPVIVVSASHSLESRLMALEAGADDVFVKPFDDQLLLARVRNLLRARQEVSDLTAGREDVLLGMSEPATDFAPPGVIAFVTDHPEAGLAIRRDLGPLMRDQIVTISYGEVLSDTPSGHQRADLYMLDTNAKEGERSLRMLSDLRTRSASRHAGICLMLSQNLRNTALMAFDMGANEILDHSMTMQEVALRLRMILRRKRNSDRTREKLQNGLRMAMIDPLTGLFNRRYATARLGAMAERAQLTGKPFAVLIADIDRFKSVNDRFGHSAGDQVLIEVAQRLIRNLRGDDLLARIGGEEFLIALPETDLETAGQIAQRLRAQMETRPMLLPNGTALRVTISIGLAISSEARLDSTSLGSDCTVTLIEKADGALMHSKAAGRNMVSIAHSAA